MTSNMIWAYLIHLGECMWGDFEPGDGGKCLFTQKPTFTKDAWLDITAMLKEKKCCNMIIIDIGEGVEFESHPEIKSPWAWTKKELADELARLRALGFEVIPKLNFSTGHDKWMGVYSRMVSTPQYYQFCTDVINEISELFGYPRFFHIGMDEECAAVQKKYSICIVRQNELFLHDLDFLFKAVEKNGARPWMWADHIWHTPELACELLKRLSHEGVYSNWYYGDWMPTKTYFQSVMDTYSILEKHGFDQIPTAGNCKSVIEYSRENMVRTVENCTKIISPEHLLGFMMTSWEKTNTEKLPRHEEATDMMKEGFESFYCK